MTPAWHFDEEELQAEQAVDGWYALLPTLTPEQAAPAEVLRRYKGQGAVERRYSDFKGPWPSRRSSCRTTSVSPPWSQ